MMNEKEFDQDIKMLIQTIYNLINEIYLKSPYKTPIVVYLDVRTYDKLKYYAVNYYSFYNLMSDEIFGCKVYPVMINQKYLHVVKV